MRIVIVGAGIGGLAAALSLEAAGFHDIRIFERSAEVKGLGVGINLLPHAMRELTELGLDERISALGVPPTTLAYYNRFGQPIWSEPRGLDAGYHWPQMSVHRGRLQLALLDAVTERLGDVVALDHKLVAVDDDTNTARFETPQGVVDVAADVIVGADGIHSALRKLRYPEDGDPVWSGLTLWRGIAVVPAFLDGRTMIMAGDGEQKFVAYPLSAPDASGFARVNFIAERRGVGSPVPTPSPRDADASRGASGGVGPVDWNRAIDRAPIVDLFREWTFDWLDVPGVVANAEEILEYPMVDRNALPRWTFGRTTLLGDAAHAMYPNGSNGASQAIIDGRTLAYRLARSGTVAEALDAYDADRRPAMTALLESTRATGPERVMLLAHERAPEGFADIHDVIPADELVEVATAYKKAAGFDPSLLNERASLSARVAE